MPKRPVENSGLIKVLSGSSLISMLSGAIEGANSGMEWMEKAAVQLHGH